MIPDELMKTIENLVKQAAQEPIDMTPDQIRQIERIHKQAAQGLNEMIKQGVQQSGENSPLTFENFMKLNVSEQSNYLLALSATDPEALEALNSQIIAEAQKLDSEIVVVDGQNLMAAVPKSKLSQEKLNQYWAIAEEAMRHSANTELKSE